MNVTLIACFFLFDNMICWPDDRAYRILMKASELLMAYRNPVFFLKMLFLLVLFSKTISF